MPRRVSLNTLPLAIAHRLIPTLSNFLYHQDDFYPFPYLEVCFSEGNGCDQYIDDCLGSAQSTVFDSCGTVVDVEIQSPEEVSSSTMISYVPLLLSVGSNIQSFRMIPCSMKYTHQKSAVSGGSDVSGRFGVLFPRLKKIQFYRKQC